jgi:hypothetical protein
MKITKQQLKQLIKEELSTLNEFGMPDASFVDDMSAGDVESQGHAAPMKRIEDKLQKILDIVRTL